MNCLMTATVTPLSMPSPNSLASRILSSSIQSPHNWMWRAGYHDPLPYNIFAHTQRSGTWITRGVRAQRRREHAGNSGWGGVRGQCVTPCQEKRAVLPCRAIPVIVPGIFTIIILFHTILPLGASPAVMVGMRNGPLTLMYLNAWSLAGSFWGKLWNL